MGRRRGPNLRFNEAQVSEELKITIALSLKKFVQNEDQKELELPSSLTSEERKYIHFVAQQMGFKSKSRGKGSGRYLTVYKKEGSTIMSIEAMIALSEMTRSTILSLLHRCPVTNKERQDLLPATERDRLMNPELRDLSVLRSLGRLTPGPPQVPPQPSLSDLMAEARKLPMWNMKDQLLQAIHHNQVIMVAGETGSGKTTQVPQMLLQEASTLSKPCRIFCTQPRRISALTIAERVAAERGEKVGYTVGYQIRLESKLSPKTLLTFCTNGVLLRTLMGGDSSLASVTHILVDEIHERDRFTDFLLIVLRDCLPKFRHLKLVLMSASLDISLYAKYFNNCPVIDVPGRCYPVKEYYLEDTLKYMKYETKEMRSACLELDQRQSGQQTVTSWTKKISQQGGPGGSSGTDDKITNSNGAAKINIGFKGPQGHIGGDLDKVLRQEMDQCLEQAFLTGSEESFSQIMYLIMSENVSPDFQHSVTLASPLMVAAGRGCVDIIEQLLSLGASLTLKAANNWTAAAWARSTQQQEALDLITTYSACEGVDLLSLNDGCETSRGSSDISPEDKRLLDSYQLSVLDEYADIDLIFALTLKIHTAQPPGSILIFLPGYDDIVTLRDRIIAEERQFLKGGKYCLFCLHSSMQSSDQKRVFRPAPPGVRKMILSTNIAETSVTINDVVYVIDSSKHKEVSYDAMTGVSSLRVVWVSLASAQQRRGRAGRCQPGIVYHLMSRARNNILQPYQTPEILRTPLQELCLHTKLLAPANMPIADFLARAPQPPAFMVIRNAVQLLKSMDALDGWEDVTELGHHLLDLPLPPRLAKMVITATVLKCLDPVLTIAASLAYKDPFMIPKNPSEKRTANAIRRKFAAGTNSDHMVLLRAFQAWQKACGEGWERGWCDRNFVSGATMEMIHGMRAQVLAQLRGAGFVRARGPGDIRDVNSNSDNWAMVKAALVSGMYPNLIRVDREQAQLRTQKESKVRLHPSSSMLEMGGRNNGPISAVHWALVQSLVSDWLVYDEMVRIGVVAHVRTVTLVSPLTVLLLAGPMRLPLDALSEPSNSCSGEYSSDSESEERPAGHSCLVRLDPWIQFLGDPQSAHLALELRHKLHAALLRRLRAPNKPLTQADEDVVRVVAGCLNQEEAALGLVQPSGVGQRPRPLYSHTHPHEGGWSGGTSEDSQTSRSSSRRTSDTTQPTTIAATTAISAIATNRQPTTVAPAAAISAIASNRQPTTIAPTTTAISAIASNRQPTTIAAATAPSSIASHMSKIISHTTTTTTTTTTTSASTYSTTSASTTSYITKAPTKQSLTSTGVGGNIKNNGSCNNNKSNGSSNISNNKSNGGNNSSSGISVSSTVARTTTASITTTTTSNTNTTSNTKTTNSTTNSTTTTTNTNSTNNNTTTTNSTPKTASNTSQSNKLTGTVASTTISSPVISSTSSKTRPTLVTTSSATPTTETTTAVSSSSAVTTVSSSSTVTSAPSTTKASTTTTKTATNTAKTATKDSKESGATSGGRARFFVMKASTYKQLEASYHTGLWSFTSNTEKKIVQAAQNGPVVLIFTLHRGGQFNGYARFTGDKTEEKCGDITNVGGPPLGALFKVDWVKKWNVGFHQTRRLFNPYNDNLQVHMSRDGQELESGVGEALVRLWDKGSGGGGGAGGGGSGGGGYRGPNPYMVAPPGGPPMMHDPPGPPPPRHPLHPNPYNPFHPGPFRGYGNDFRYSGGNASVIRGFRPGFRGVGGPPGYRR